MMLQSLSARGESQYEKIGTPSQSMRKGSRHYASHVVVGALLANSLSCCSSALPLLRQEEQLLRRCGANPLSRLEKPSVLSRHLVTLATLGGVEVNATDDHR